MTVAHPALAPPRITSRPSPDGGVILRSEMPLEPYEASLGVLLRRWAEEAPDRTFLAERGPDGEWVSLTWAQVDARASAIAQALLDLGLGADRMAMILSGNSIDHALLTLGGFLAGVPVVPVSPAYSLLSVDYGKVRHIVDLVKPGLVFAQGDAFDGVLGAVDFGGAEIVGEPPASEPTGAVDDALARVGPESVAKVLFTSGSTAMPKGVLNTHGMLCANQQSLAQIWPFTEATPPVLVDWLPWNHTFGANHNFNHVLKRGGTIYIDGGRPTPPLMPITVRNLTEIAPTIYFNVPARLRRAASVPGARRGAARALLRAPRADLLRRRGAAAGPVDAAGGGRDPRARRAGPDDVGVGPDRDVAAGDVGALPDRSRGRDRRADPRRGDQARRRSRTSSRCA